MAGTWRAIPGETETYTRPLGKLETAFAWDTISNGVADSRDFFFLQIDESN